MFSLAISLTLSTGIDIHIDTKCQPERILSEWCQNRYSAFTHYFSNTRVKRREPVTKNRYSYLSQYQGNNFTMVSVTTDLAFKKYAQRIYRTGCIKAVGLLKLDNFQQNRMKMIMNIQYLFYMLLQCPLLHVLHVAPSIFSACDTYVTGVKS